MVDHKRLDALTRLIERSGAKLIAVGDGKQLPSIGPGGMFDRLTSTRPPRSSQTSTAPSDPDERSAWAALRAGEPERAMAHYHSRGQLHLHDTRDQAGEARRPSAGPRSPRHRDIREVALIADASNVEIDRLNARAQHLRARARRTRAPRDPAARHQHYGLREGDLDRLHRPAPPPRAATGRERHPRPGHRHPRPGRDRHARRLRARDPARRRGPRVPATRLRPARLPPAGRDRRALRRAHRRLADQQGDRLRPGHPRPRRHRAGSSPATSSASKGRTTARVSASPNRCATAARKHHHSHTQSCPTQTGGQDSESRSRPAAPAAYPASPAPSAASPNHQHQSEHDEPQATNRPSR